MLSNCPNSVVNSDRLLSSIRRIETPEVPDEPDPDEPGDRLLSSIRRIETEIQLIGG